MSQNLYSYVGNNPINYFDPTGHKGEWLQKAGKFLKDVGKAIKNAYEYWDASYNNIKQSVTQLSEVKTDTYTVDLPDGVMAVSEKVRTLGPIQYGTAVVYDEEKYAGYVIFGFGVGSSKGGLLPFIGNLTTGIANIINPEDYTGAFVTIGSQSTDAYIELGY